jgi:hypothetical protein
VVEAGTAPKVPLNAKVLFSKAIITDKSPHFFHTWQWLTLGQNLQFLSVLFLINIWMFGYSFANVRQT